MLRPEATAAIIPLLMMVLLAGPGLCVQRIEPPPCKEGRECLPYTVVCHGDGYEARRYPASAWVGTSINSSMYSAAVFRGFSRLFRYIQGRNEKGVKIPMTAPVVTQVVEGPGVQTIRVFFMVPEAFRADTPVPTEATVYLEQFPPLDAYVRFFGGWMTDASHLAQLSNLDTRLQQDGRTTKVGVHYTAGFNSPWELKNRRNEVWRIAVGELGCGSTLRE